jgi:hypothetical protein
LSASGRDARLSWTTRQPAARPSELGACYSSRATAAQVARRAQTIIEHRASIIVKTREQLNLRVASVCWSAGRSIIMIVRYGHIQPKRRAVRRLQHAWLFRSLRSASASLRSNLVSKRNLVSSVVLVSAWACARPSACACAPQLVLCPACCRVPALA